MRASSLNVLETIKEVVKKPTIYYFWEKLQLKELHGRDCFVLTNRKQCENQLDSQL